MNAKSKIAFSAYEIVHYRHKNQLAKYGSSDFLDKSGALAKLIFKIKRRRSANIPLLGELRLRLPRPIQVRAENQVDIQVSIFVEVPGKSLVGAVHGKEKRFAKFELGCRVQSFIQQNGDRLPRLRCNHRNIWQPAAIKIGNRAEQQSGERSKAAVPGPPVPWLRFRLTDAKFHLLILQSDARVAM